MQAEGDEAERMGSRRCGVGCCERGVEGGGGVQHSPAVPVCR